MYAFCLVFLVDMRIIMVMQLALL
ncbi:hypothetical protein OIU84_028324, partial [Salix udensis]